jgi:hypothetical protein
MIVNGDPVSIRAVGIGVREYSRPIPSPASMSSKNLVTENLMHGPGSGGSKGFHGILCVRISTRQNTRAAFSRSALPESRDLFRSAVFRP